MLVIGTTGTKGSDNEISRRPRSWLPLLPLLCAHAHAQDLEDGDRKTKEIGCWPAKEELIKKCTDHAKTSDVVLGVLDGVLSEVGSSQGVLRMTKELSPGAGRR